MSEYLSPPLEYNPNSLLEIFHEYMEANIPGWEPAAGNLDERIGGAVSQLTAQLNEAASEGATNIFRYFGANIAGIVPQEAAQATGIVTIVMIDELGHTVPTGTVIVWINSRGNRVAFETIEEATVAESSKEVSGIHVRAVIGGTEANGIEGNATELATSLPFVSAVKFVAPSNGGVEEESDAEYLEKLVKEFRLLTPKPITASDFSIDLLGRTNVGRATTIGGFNAAGTVTESVQISTNTKLTEVSEATCEKIMVGTEVSGTGIAVGTVVTEIKQASKEVIVSKATTKTEKSSITFKGTLRNGGFVTSWVGNNEGEALTTVEEGELEKAIQGECLTGVEFRVRRPNYTPINVEAVVFAWPEQNNEQVKAAAESAIRSYLSPSHWGQPPKVSAEGQWFNEPHVRQVNVESALLGVFGMHYVKELKLNGSTADLLMTGFVPLPFTGSSTIKGKTTAASKTITNLASTEKITVGSIVTGPVLQIKELVQISTSTKITELATATCEALEIGSEVSGTGVEAGTVVTEINVAGKEVVVNNATTKTEKSTLTFKKVKATVGEVKSSTEVKLTAEASKTESEVPFTFKIPITVTVNTG